jgi:hypothetical protein
VDLAPSDAPDHWYDLEAIHQMVLAEDGAVTDVDEEPVPGSTTPRWKRNLAAVLQKWKRTEELDWDGHARYRLRSRRT